MYTIKINQGVDHTVTFVTSDLGLAQTIAFSLEKTLPLFGTADVTIFDNTDGVTLLWMTITRQETIYHINAL